MKNARVVLVMALVISMVPSVFAVTIKNGSFEDPVLGGPAAQDIKDWGGTKDQSGNNWDNVYHQIPQGVWNMPTTPDGTQMALVAWYPGYLTSVPGVPGATTGIWTDIGTVEDNTDYAFAWLSGQDGANPQENPYDVSIWAGDEAGPLERLDVATFLTPGVLGTWEELSTTLNSGAGYAGQPLWLMFSMTEDAPGAGICGGYDWCNMLIDGVVPEPASICLLGLGSLALIRRRRRRA